VISKENFLGVLPVSIDTKAIESEEEEKTPAKAPVREEVT
jgi:hypothetical protein